MKWTIKKIGQKYSLSYYYPLGDEKATIVFPEKDMKDLKKAVDDILRGQ